MVGYIYLITDTTNGMKYTGKHHYHIEGQLDPNYHGSGTIIKNIYKKRPETLKEEYIKTCYSEEQMNSDEQYYIKLFKTLWPNGYNLTEGGEGCVASEETRRKLSLSKKGKPLTEKQLEKRKGLFVGEKNPMYGKTLSEEHRRKIGNANKGKPAPNKGKPMSEETKKKMSKTHTNGKLSKRVLQLTLDGEFVREWESANECGRNGFNQGAVSACCRGELKSHKGFIFKYK